MLAAAGLALAVGLWWREGGVREVHDTAGLLTSLGRVAGMAGGYLALVEVLLLARIPLVDRALGARRVARAHRVGGIAVLALVLAHAALITAGYALQDGVGPIAELRTLLGDYPWMLPAAGGLVLLLVVVATSAPVVRRRLSHRTWHGVHLLAYVAVALAFAHQLTTGHEFQHQPVARAAWIGLHVLALAALVGLRVALPVAVSRRHRLHVRRVVAEAPGVVSLEVGGVGLDRLGAEAGQFFHWRFLAPGLWREAHPFSLSEAPDGRRLRVTVKGSGDFTGKVAAIRPGTRVLVEGPCGELTAAARRRPRVALIAGGVGIAPLRALLQDLEGAPGEITLLYRAGAAGDVLFGPELDALARERGVEVHYLLGDGPDLLGPAELRRLVPDIAARDVFVCGPPGMTTAVSAGLRRAGVPARHIISEAFG